MSGTDRHARPASGEWPVAADAERVAPEYRRRIELSSIGRREAHIPFDTTETERAAIADHLGLQAIEALEGSATVEPWSSGARLHGHLTARVVQTCVVTLDPVTADIEQDFARRYLPEERPYRESRRAPMEAIDLRVDEEDAPEPLHGGGIELGDVVVEELSLALDPFPRCPEARLDGVEAPDEEEPHPFAALARLKDRG